MIDRRALAHSVVIGGMSFQVKASASADELDRLAARVDTKLRTVKPKGPWQPRDLALVALALAHDAEEAERRADDATTSLAAAATDREADAHEELRRVMAERDAAIARAEAEAQRRRDVEAEARDVMRRILSRIDLALEEDELAEAGEPAPLS